MYENVWVMYENVWEMFGKSRFIKNNKILHNVYRLTSNWDKK